MEEPLGLKFRPKTAGPSPELKANVLTFFTWQWMQKLINTGNKKTLEREDLYDLLPRECTEYCEREWNKNAEKQKSIQGKLSVSRLIYRAAGRELLFSFLCLPIWLGSVISQVYTIRAIVQEAENFGQQTHWWRGFLLVFSMWATSVVQSLSQHWSFTFGQKSGMKIKAAVSMAVFNQVLKLRTVTMGGISSGLMLNLVNNDTQKFVDCATFLAYTSFSIPDCIVVAALAISEVGLAAVPGVAVILLAQPINVSIAQALSKIRKHAVKLTDARVRCIGEILSGIRVVKYNGWTNAFLKRVETIRQMEMLWIRRATYLRATTSAFKDTITPIAALATFGTYVALNDGILSASKAFTVLGFYSILVRVYHIAPPGAQYAWESWIGIQRLQLLMNLPNGSGLTSFENEENIRKIYPGAAVVVSEGTFAWYIKEKEFEAPNLSARSNGSEKSTNSQANGSKGVPGKGEVSLKDINLAVNKGELIAVIGSVGSGKTSLLMAILGEMECVRGTFWTERMVSYAPQQPWILNDNVRNNIICANEYDDALYKKVIFACALEHDIQQLPAGDDTEIGERGVNLSGGQKARVSLARACYSTCPVVLLDDPLAAVDVPTARHLMQHVLGGILKGRTVILITHNKSSLELVDRIFVMEDGRLEAIKSKENLAEMGLVHEDAEDSDDGLIEEEDDESSGDEVVEENYIGPDGGTLQQTPTQRVENSGFLGELDGYGSEKIEVRHSLSSVGKSDSKRSSLNIARRSSSVRRSGSMHRRHSVDDITLAKAKAQRELEELGALTVKEDRVVGEVTWKTYFDYAKGGGVFTFFIALVLMGLAQAVRILVDYWVSAWVTDKYNQSTNIYLTIYGTLVAGSVALCLARGYVFTEQSIRAAKSMHRDMAQNVFRSPQLFFDQNPVGRILNRFSKDQSMVDELLPYTAQAMFENLIGVLGVMIFIAVIMPWFLLSLPPFVAAFYYGQQRYVKVSRELKRLDGLSRSPIYAHFAQTLQGMTSVRAFGMEGAMHDHFRDLMDGNHRAFILFVHSSRWLGSRLDFAAAICVATASALTVVLRDQISPGLIGVVLLESLQLTGFFQYGVRLIADTENLFTSVERIQTYGNLVTEASPDSPPGLVSEHWPEKGEVEFVKYTMAYRVDLPPVLNSLTFKVLPREKVGILGRTGAGKSSLAAALFRMVENSACSGTILVDGVDLKLVGLDDLRLRLSIIPQDPVLFKGSVRLNLDPFELHNDDELHEALAKVQLTSKIRTLTGDLSSEVAENGDNFSVGQRQLLCLARCLLRKSKIIVMDEATAAVDGETDQLIQNAMRLVFKDCTVLTIAHRIDTIIDCDRVLVLGKGGRISEFDSPLNLLKRAEDLNFADNTTIRVDHVFANMVAQAGPTVARELRKAAEVAHQKKMLATSNPPSQPELNLWVV